jgi:hypothetical protein
VDCWNVFDIERLSLVDGRKNRREMSDYAHRLCGVLSMARDVWKNFSNMRASLMLILTLLETHLLRSSFDSGTSCTTMSPQSWQLFGDVKSNQMNRSAVKHSLLPMSRKYK